jgi:hypothetical protein
MMNMMTIDNNGYLYNDNHYDNGDVDDEDENDDNKRR